MAPPLRETDCHSSAVGAPVAVGPEWAAAARGVQPVRPVLGLEARGWTGQAGTSSSSKAVQGHSAEAVVVGDTAAAATAGTAVRQVYAEDAQLGDEFISLTFMESESENESDEDDEEDDDDEEEEEEAENDT